MSMLGGIMLQDIFSRSLNYFSQHAFLNSIAHSAGGFGLAVVLQHYLKGDVFISPYLGWLLIAASVVIHIRSCMKQ